MSGLGGLAAFARGGVGVGESELVELMQLPPEELLVRQRGADARRPGPHGPAQPNRRQ
jgi:hypothetical protein